MISSIAERLRTLDMEDSRGTTVEERLALVQSLLEDAIELTVAVQGLTREEALDAIGAGHKVGRRSSVLNRT